MKKQFFCVIGGAFIFVLFAIVSTADFEDAKSNEQVYCDMVSKWEAAVEKGIPQHDRDGWPPYNGKEQCKIYWQKK